MITHILPEVQSFSWWNLKKKKEEKLAVKESFFPTSWSCIVELAQTLTEGYSCALTSTHNLSLHFSSIESLPSVYMLEACTVHHQHLFTSEEHKHCFWIRSNLWSETTKSLNRRKKKYKKQGGGVHVDVSEEKQPLTFFKMVVKLDKSSVWTLFKSL